MASDSTPRPISSVFVKDEPTREVHDRFPPHDRVHRHREQHARHHGGQRRRRLGMGVGQPRVHRRETGLGPVSDQQEHERQAHDVGMQVRGGGHQHRPVERAFRQASLVHEVEVGQHGADKRQRDADRPDQDVLPRGLDRRLADAQRNQHRRHDGRGLDGHPHQADVVHRHRQEHREAQQVGEHHEMAHLAIVERDPASVVRAQPRGQRGNQARAHGQQRRQRVGPRNPPAAVVVTPASTAFHRLNAATIVTRDSQRPARAAIRAADAGSRPSRAANNGAPSRTTSSMRLTRSGGSDLQCFSWLNCSTSIDSNVS